MSERDVAERKISVSKMLNELLNKKVKLREDVLIRHSRSVPAHLGYTHEQFVWRDLLRKLKGKKGKIMRTFPESSHVNVKFGKKLIGLNYKELELI